MSAREEALADQLVATGHRGKVEDGDDPMHEPVIATVKIGESTSMVFTTTPASVDGADGDAIEYLLENAGEIITQVFEAILADLEAKQAAGE